MRILTITALALALGLATPALAQDRTIPAGAFDAVQAPIDQGLSYRPVSRSPVFEGRSDADAASAANSRRASTQR